MASSVLSLTQCLEQKFAKTGIVKKVLSGNLSVKQPCLADLVSLKIYIVINMFSVYPIFEPV